MGKQQNKAFQDVTEGSVDLGGGGQINVPQTETPFNPFIVAASNPIEAAKDTKSLTNQGSVVAGQMNYGMSGSLGVPNLQQSQPIEQAPATQQPGLSLPNLSTQQNQPPLLTPEQRLSLAETFGKGGSVTPGINEALAQQEVSPENFLFARGLANGYIAPDVSNLTTEDYYPTLNRQIAQGMFQGEQGYAAPIFAAGGMLPPLKVMDARLAALQAKPKFEMPTYDTTLSPWDQSLDKWWFDLTDEYIQRAKQYGPRGLDMLMDPSTDLGREYLEAQQKAQSLYGTIDLAHEMIKGIRDSQVKNDASVTQMTEGVINRFMSGVSGFGDDPLASYDNIVASMKQLQSVHSVADHWTEFLKRPNYNKTFADLNEVIKNSKSTSDFVAMQQTFNESVFPQLGNLVNQYISEWNARGPEGQRLINELYGYGEGSLEENLRTNIGNTILANLPDRQDAKLELVYKNGTYVNVYNERDASKSTIYKDAFQANQSIRSGLGGIDYSAGSDSDRLSQINDMVSRPQSGFGAPIYSTGDVDNKNKGTGAILDGQLVKSANVSTPYAWGRHYVASGENRVSGINVEDIQYSSNVAFRFDFNGKQFSTGDFIERGGKTYSANIGLRDEIVKDSYNLISGGTTEVSANLSASYGTMMASIDIPTKNGPIKRWVALPKEMFAVDPSTMVEVWVSNDEPPKQIPAGDLTGAAMDGFILELEGTESKYPGSKGERATNRDISQFTRGKSYVLVPALAHNLSFLDNITKEQNVQKDKESYAAILGNQGAQGHSINLNNYSSGKSVKTKPSTAGGGGDIVQKNQGIFNVKK